jgi:tyrosyl-tRNA synthetase
VPLRLCRQLQEQGHTLDLVLGTLTAQLGDPSGQDKTRPILDEAEVKANADSLLAQCRKVLLPGFTVHRNHEFVENMSIPMFLTRLAARITVAGMLSRDGFRRRMDSGQAISLHELLVPLLQGWDSVKLRAEVEIGGTDQLFNFQVARRLQEAEGQKPQVALMTPVIRGTDGRKMSKSFGNTIWLDEIPEEMFGQVMSIPDDVMEEWIPLLCDRDLSTITHPRDRKRALALDLVTQLHGPVAAEEALAHFQRVVVNHAAPNEVPVVPKNDLVTLVAAVRGESRGKARRLIEGGGVRVDGLKVLDHKVEPSSGSLVKVGKRVFVRVR